MLAKLRWGITASLVAFGFVFGAGNALAQSNLPACPDDLRNIKQRCFGTWISSSNTKYTGEFESDRASIKAEDGAFYKGEFSNGTLNGQGTVTYANGDKYVGEHRDGKLHGQGTYTVASGDVYVGEFKDGKRNGQGTYTTADGNKYVGRFKDDVPNGQGTMTYAGGDKYVGEWKDGLFNGLGTYTRANSEKHLGEWEDDLPNGRFVIYAVDGSIYQQGIFDDGELAKSQNVEAELLEALKASEAN